MNQVAFSFDRQRYRNTDPQTSKDAARAALSGKRQMQRKLILTLLHDVGPMTGKELAICAGVSFTEISRAISEVQGIHRTGLRRDDSCEWAVL